MPSEPDEVSHEPLRPHAPDGVARLFESALEAELPEQPGTCIGPYKLLERIGEGGFGVVWMAEQTDPIRRRVALKIIKSGMDTREVIARFEAERQALALMDHPNIARVLDAGATDTGRPYFVMELVRGVPITRYCDEHRLSTESRLRLFITVCQAVQHAHQKGIIHRDLKPSNILVTLHDGTAVPKVIDFGIAKATQGGLTDKTLFTRFHAFIGTPAYTSPEQMEMSGLDVDTRSDIYSLGVLLYEMLAGRPPFESESLARAGIEAMKRTICHVDPPPPSQRLSTLTQDEQSTVAHAHGIDIARLSLLLRGDLDWIVMRCLEKDRNRRYETSNGLARDIERHLASEPVVARPPSAGYRLRKFARRHKAAVAAVSAVALALVAGLVASSILLVRERAARARAVAAEEAEGALRAQAEAARAQEVKRSARTALNLAGQLLEEGKTADGLAYLVHAARRDSSNTAIAARLVSTIASRNFLIPEHAPLPCGSRVLALRYSNDGRSLFAGMEDGTFRVVDPATGTVIREVRLGHPVKRNGWVFARDDDSVCAVRFVGDTLGVLDIATGRLRFAPLTLDPRVFPGEGLDPAEMDAGFVTMSPDGRWVMAQGLFEIWTWDAATGRPETELISPSYNFPTFSPDGSRLANVTSDTLSLFSLPGGERVVGPIAISRQFARNSYLMPQFSKDGKEVAVVDPSEAIHLFDAATGERRGTWPHKDTYILPGTPQMLPNGLLFVVGAFTTDLWDLKSGSPRHMPHIGWANLQTCLPDANGDRLLMVTPAGFARLHDSTTGDLIAEETALHGSGDMVAALSPDGTQIAVGTGSGILRWLRVGRGAARPLEIPAVVSEFLPGSPARVRAVSVDRSRVIDVRTGRVVTSVEIPSRTIHPTGRNVALSPGARFLLAFDSENRGEVWDFAAEGIPRIAPLEESRQSRTRDFSQDGRFVAFSGSNSRVAGVWDLATGRLVGPLVDHENDTIGVRNFRVGPEGRLLVTGHSKGTVAIWETATGRLLHSLHTPSRATPSTIYLSSDGRRLLASTPLGEARLWNVQSGQPEGPVLEVATGGSTGSISAGAFFSPDGRWIATAGAQGTTMRDADTFAPVGSVIAVRPYNPGSMFFNRDGTRLFAGASVWDVPSGELVVEQLKEPGTPGGMDRMSFSPDGRYLHYRTRLPAGAVSRIRSVPPPLPPGEHVPDWLLNLATNIAGKTIDDAEQSVAVPATSLQIESVRRELASLPDDAPFVEWGRWILDDSPTRSIAPGFTITLAEAGIMKTDVSDSAP